MTGATVYFVAAEPSGEALAADVMDRLAVLQPDTKVFGVGGAAMAERGVISPFDISDLSVMGLVEGIKAYGLVKQRVEDTCRDILARKPDVVVLVDSWGFTWRVAKRMKELGSDALRVKLVGPQVWATRPGRAKVMARHVDHLLCIHAFEQPFYEPHGLPTTVIGNPALGRGDLADPTDLINRLAWPAGTRALGLLLGSRNAEMRTVAPVLVEAAKQVCDARPDVRVLCVVPASVRQQVTDFSKSWTFPFDLVESRKDKFSAFAMMEVALACSGTVTTELALQRAPVIVGYKIGWVTWAIARAFLMKSKFITLLNVAAGREIAPEFVQTRFTSGRLSNAALRLLDSEEERQHQIKAQNAALESMGAGGPNPATLAAEKIVELVGHTRTQ